VIHGGAQVVVFTGKLGAIFLRSISADVSNQQHLRYVFQFFKKINQENQSTPEFEPNNIQPHLKKSKITSVKCR
jgi:hypothetical protein